MIVALLVVIAGVLIVGIWPALAVQAAAAKRMAAAQEAQLRVYTSWCESQEPPFGEPRVYAPEELRS